jgi:hypothetical protein
MNTNRLAAHVDIAAFDGAHFTFAQHPQNTFGGFFWIVQQRVRSRSRNKPAVVQVIAVCENFARDSQTMRLAGAGKLAVVRREKN